MESSPKLLYKTIEDKTIVWIANKNEYVVVENQTATILKKIENGETIHKTSNEISAELNIPFEEVLPFVEKLTVDFLTIHKSKESDKIDSNIEIPKNFNFIKYYKINNLVFKVAFDDELELSYVHPKFAHLVVENPSTIDFSFEVFLENSHIFLYVDGDFIGLWNKTEIHFFQGKFSMELIQKIHNKTEDEWLGVFHASAVSNGEKSILFLGDSGNGKSTSLSLLQANGFTCLADDFVPVDKNKQQIYSFPAAISIKKTSLSVLLSFYPELQTSAEYHFTRLNKIVRYLKPNNTDFFSNLPCKELIFIKYEKDSGIICNKISNLYAFEQLVPDSWLSPELENAKIFLDWFSGLKCYQIKYSDNIKMIDTVSKIFENEF
ncbi:hypothetical protein N9V96_02805 [Polaribacter sp.]|nr:hypothetical protein [Polaribacter sp.]